MSVGPFQHPILGRLLGDDALAACFDAAADVEAMLDFERALARAEAAEGLIEPAAAESIAMDLARFEADYDALAEGTARDGVVVPALLKQLRTRLSPQAAKALHKGATSQDVIDASAAIRLKRAASIIDGRLADLIGRFDEWEAKAGATTVMAHTRMQAAKPTVFARKLAAWRDPLARCRGRLSELSDRAFVLRFGGAVGDRADLGERDQAVADHVAAELGLASSATSLHSERDGIAEFASWLSLVTGVLGKFGQDAALSLQNEVGELKLAGGGGSSAMPHKSNPVGPEVLVTLARFNATLLAGLHQSLVHENERSGAAWTLEWMLLPQMATATGAATRVAGEVLAHLSLAPGGKDD
ncbi:3-carboxy-cis,cis-muconate cycloisomerase [Mangrovibrevibacter kandeliae]|uniref:3-carboxy-cis,cis-muconate cycloisomerase n=1 Tax=Mangrovibrevibacter kandeliae TaxID=2968473 RepID=UPI0021181CD0|nr:3-carboxy-cis,cis-muconate cycloisomerase [Aurantimonas sp. CSK15Z-1]MCQ8780849.1 3-carboxy-cis,cis-muconate cycloisomerase [Aurantimonas sp. CSK15Z-1]